MKNSRINRPGKTVVRSRYAGKGKLVVAVALMLLMGFMWIRVILRKGPNAASAAAPDPQTLLEMQQMVADQPSPQPSLTPVKLLKIPGRNDQLSRDVFICRHKQAFGWDEPRIENPPEPQPTEQTFEIERQRHKTNLLKIAQNLMVEAVIVDTQNRPQKAFIDGTVVTLGSKLKIMQDNEKYEFTVHEIQPKAVILAWDSFSIKIKMSQSNLAG